MADLALVRPHRPSAAAVLDLGERGLLGALFVRLVVRNWSIMWTASHWFNLLLVISEGLAVALLLVRRRSDDISRRPSDWLWALLATAGPLLVQAGGGRPLIPGWLGAVLLVGGLLTQAGAKLALGRSFGLVAANRGVKVAGPYRLVRHPMYLGYMSVQVGYLLLAPNGWNVLIYAVSFSAQVVRLLAEERLLARDPDYRTFQQQTRWRLLPFVF